MNGMRVKYGWDFCDALWQDLGEGGIWQAVVDPARELDDLFLDRSEIDARCPGHVSSGVTGTGKRETCL